MLERQREGIGKARLDGKYKGGNPQIGLKRQKSKSLRLVECCVESSQKKSE